MSFDTHRPALLALAWRMLGSLTEAEDVVQEAWIRWERADDVRHPRAWLTRVVTHLCLDQLRSARVQREVVGERLPEPVASSDPGAATVLEMADSVSIAFLTLLQRLTPLRATVEPVAGDRGTPFP